MQFQSQEAEFESQGTLVDIGVADGTTHEVEGGQVDPHGEFDGQDASDSDGTVGPQFSVKEVVDVMPRLWAGINKPGGVARITKVNYDAEEDEYTYNVSYIVHGGGETRVEQIYINRLEMEAPSARQQHIRGRCRYA
jgi:hypothetical protein